MSSYSFLITFISLFLTCQTAVITVPPVSVTVPPFTATTFTCEGTGDMLNWFVESAVLNNSIAQERQITVTTTTVNNTNFSSALTVNAIPINDDLGIGCEIITISPFDRVIASNNLTIRGVSPVEDIQHSTSYTSNNSLLITWSPPVYYSNDIPHGSPVSYQVLVTDEDGDVILDTTPNTNITVPNITQCDTVNVSLTALVGQYESSDNTISNNGSYSVTIRGAFHHSVSFEVSSMPSHCEKKLFVKDESDGSILVDEILSADYKNITLEPFRKYRLLAEVKNLRDKVKDTKDTYISTYNVQDVLVSIEGNGSVSVQCVFVSGSTTDGCHVIFTDTSNGRNESFDISESDSSTLVSVSTSGVYDVAVFDIVNGLLYGPAVYYPTRVDIIKVTPPISTSFSIASESTTASTQYTVANTINPTITDAPEINIHVSPTSVPIMTYIIPIVAGILGGSSLVVLIILAVCVSITVYKRKRMKVQVLIRSEFATIYQPEAETRNPCQDVHELRNEAPITIGSPVILTSHRLINEENPYHVTRSKGEMIQQPCPSLTSTTTQETTPEDSISSTTLNSINDNAYTIEPAVTVSNATVSVTVTNTADVPTYASIAKRTDTTAIPAVDQRVEYDTVTGDSNKKGDVKFCHHDDNANNIVTGILNSTTNEDEVANLSESPPHDNLNTITGPVIEPNTESITASPQAVPNEFFYSKSEEVSEVTGASTVCVTSPAKH